MDVSVTEFATPFNSPLKQRVSLSPSKDDYLSPKNRRSETVGNIQETADDENYNGRLIEGKLRKIKAEGGFIDRYVYVTNEEVKYYKSEWAASLWGKRPINTIHLSRISHALVNTANPKCFEIFKKPGLRSSSPLRSPSPLMSYSPGMTINTSKNISVLLDAAAKKLKNIKEKHHLMLMPIAAEERVNQSASAKKGWSQREVKWYENERRMFFEAGSAEEAEEWVKVINSKVQHHFLYSFN